MADQVADKDVYFSSSSKGLCDDLEYLPLHNSAILIISLLTAQ